MTYSPITDGDPDPGEIVWTWVPFEERDGRGKDRPVLVVAAERGGTYLAVQLTSKPHPGDVEFVPIGVRQLGLRGPAVVGEHRPGVPGASRRDAAGDAPGLPAARRSRARSGSRLSGQRCGWRLRSGCPAGG